MRCIETNILDIKTYTTYIKSYMRPIEIDLFKLKSYRLHASYNL